MDNAQSQIHVGEAPLMERVPQESQMEKDVFQPEEGEANESFEEARNHNRAPPANDAQSEMTSAPSPAPPARRQSAITEALQKRMQDMNSANKGGRTPQEKPAKEEPMPSVSLREFMDAAEVKFMSDGSLLQRRSSVNQYEAEMPKLETDEDKITFLALTAEVGGGGLLFCFFLVCGSQKEQSSSPMVFVCFASAGDGRGGRSCEHIARRSRAGQNEA